MTKKPADYCTHSRHARVGDLSVAILTMNLNNKQPNDGEVLYKRFGEEIGRLKERCIPDILVIGVQEIVAYNRLWKYSSMCEVVEQEEINTCTDIRIKWMLHFATRMVGHTFDDIPYMVRAACAWCTLSIIVLVKKKFSAYIGNTQFACCPTGIGGVYGNKGALGAIVEVNLKHCCHFDGDNCKNALERFRKLKISFVNAHLSAFEGEVYKTMRDSQITHILSNLSFRKVRGPVYVGVSLNDSDVIFFFGDLNYRLKVGKIKRSPTDAVREKIVNGEIDTLVQMDELKRSIKYHEVLKYFKEPVIRFLPTYKKEQRLLNIQSEKYDVNNYDTHKRLPAYCDRILTSSSAANGLRNVTARRNEYKSATSLSSDNTLGATANLNTVRKSIYTKSNRSALERKNKIAELPQYTVQPLMYNSIQNSIMSDHDPVIGLFELKLDKREKSPPLMGRGTPSTCIRHIRRKIKTYLT